MSLVICCQVERKRTPCSGHFTPPTPLNARLIWEKKDHIGLSLNNISNPLYARGKKKKEKKRIREFNFNVFHVK